MGIMKRLTDWRRYYPPLPQPLRAFAGLEPHRDPEAFLEKKRAEREAREERAAIQAVERDSEKDLAKRARVIREPIQPPPKLNPQQQAAKATAAAAAIDNLNAERQRIEDLVRAYFRVAIRQVLDPATVSSRDETVNADASDSESPRLAAAGWYRVGSTFYRIGSGPHPAFYAVKDSRRAGTVQRREPAKLQLNMFE